LVLRGFFRRFSTQCWPRRRWIRCRFNSRRGDWTHYIG